MSFNRLESDERLREALKEYHVAYKHLSHTLENELLCGSGDEGKELREYIAASALMERALFRISGIMLQRM